MSRTKRRLLFWLAVTVFAVITPLIVGYARGYRVDFRRGGIGQVGAIFLESRPKGAIVFIDNKNVDEKTPALLANLFPFENYLVEIKKEGFKNWRKKLLVEPSKINRVEQIILPPEEFLPEDVISTTTPLVDFFLEPDGRFGLGVREERKGTFGLYLVELASRTFTPIVFPDRLTTLGIEKLAWKNDAAQAVFLRLTRSGKSWYLLDVPSRTLTSLNLAFPSLPKPLFIRFLPTGGLLALTEKSVILIDRDLKNRTDLKLEGVKMLEVGDNQIFALTDRRALVKFDPQGSLIKDYGRLEFEPSAFQLSPDGKKIIYRDENKLGVLWVSNAERAPFFKIGDQEIIFETTERIKSSWWHASSEGFFVFLENKELIFGELDGRGGRNIWRWEMADTGQIAYSSKEKYLWFLTNEGFLARYQDKF